MLPKFSIIGPWNVSQGKRPDGRTFYSLTLRGQEPLTKRKWDSKADAVKEAMRLNGEANIKKYKKIYRSNRLGKSIPV